MLQSANYKDKKALIVGLGRSGIGAASLLDSLGASVIITDQKPASDLEDFIKKVPSPIKLAVGDYPTELLKEIDLVVVSPGVPLDIPLIQKVRRLNIPVIGELELAYIVESTPFIAITGTNGKTTTTTLVDHILRISGYKTELCGNIGQAVTEKVLKNRANGNVHYMVTEVSSFQLETISRFHPKVAMILNITPDHLDRHKSMEEYTRVKARIYENQTKEDSLILNLDDPIAADLGKTSPVKKWFFSTCQQINGVYLHDNRLWFSNGNSLIKLLKVHEIHLKGSHNLENVMASVLACLLIGCDPVAIRQAVTSFKGISHRMESVGTVKSVTFINDSKATNPGAVLRAIEELPSIILLMGGKDKDNDFTILKNTVHQKVKRLILFGEARETINRVLGNETETIVTATMIDAVNTAFDSAVPGDVVILSPGCASFDEFKDYADRGKRFKEAVEQLRLRESG